MKVIKTETGSFIIDKEDENILLDGNWDIRIFKNIPYACCFSKRKYRSPLLHRCIMSAKKGEIVDHINGDSLDNRRSNLRIVNYSQNAMNKGPQRKKRSSKYKGVYLWNKKWWRTQIMVNGKSYCVDFLSEIDAAKKYNELALKYHGEFARLNVI